ncbi:MAG: hypothetical protein DRI75_13280 [Bacteroidetes bacterium]|nr:MAG: hypothetical protein DRI75_13280 [Bacteroidota bacterium]
MKTYKYLFVLTFVALFITSCTYQQNDDKKTNSSLLTNQYLGQKPPGITPELFAPGIVSTIYHEHSAPNFSPDGAILVYTLTCEHIHVIMEMKLENGKWSIPKPVPFSGKYDDDGHVWSNDGSKLYFRSRRPLNDTLDNKYHNWVVSRNDTGWLEPEPNSFSAYSFSKTGMNYCYFENKETGWDIFKSQKINGYRDYIKLDTNINSKDTDATPYVSKDEKYLIFASKGRDDAIGIMDLYISFKKDNGVWTKAKNMGEPINTIGHVSRFPRVSPDGKYLFYWSNIKNDQTAIDSLSMIEETLKIYSPWRPENGKDGDIYWIDAKIIEQLKPTDLNY